MTKQCITHNNLSLLDEMNRNVDVTESKMQRSMKRLTKLYNEATEKRSDCCIVTLIIILFILIILLISF